MSPPDTMLLAPTVDHEIVHHILGAIRARCGFNVHGLMIAVENGLVTLRGQVRSFYYKQLLLSAVQHVPGVEEIVDEVDVLPMTSLR